MYEAAAVCVLIQSDSHQSGLHSSQITNCFFPSAESSVVAVEGSGAEQSQQILQRQPLFGSVGACHQPAGPMRLLGL